MHCGQGSAARQSMANKGVAAVVNSQTLADTAVIRPSLIIEYVSYSMAHFLHPPGRAPPSLRGGFDG
jgi:hypothetical protein